MHMGSYKSLSFFQGTTLDRSTHLLNFEIIRTFVEMMCEADDAFLHVHLDHMQLKLRSQDYAMTSGSAFGYKIQTVQEPELTAKVPRKCSFQDCWLKDSAYQEWF